MGYSKSSIATACNSEQYIVGDIASYFQHHEIIAVLNFSPNLPDWDRNILPAGVLSCSKSISPDQISCVERSNRTRFKSASSSVTIFFALWIV